MERVIIDDETCEISAISSATVEGDDPVIFYFSDKFGNQTELIMDAIGANALRIAIASIKNIPPLVLPKNPEGECQCIYSKVHYTRNGEETDGAEFEKELGGAKPMGSYNSVDDGIILYSESGNNVCCFNCEGSALDKERLVLMFPDDILEMIKLQLDKIFPFNRFGKKNRLSYGYFKSIANKEGED